MGKRKTSLIVTEKDQEASNKQKSVAELQSLRKPKKIAEKEKRADPSTLRLGRRARADSILGDLDEFHDFKKMRVLDPNDDAANKSNAQAAEANKKWLKIRKVIEQASSKDESAPKLVLFSVPRGFDVEQLNNISG